MSEEVVEVVVPVLVAGAEVTLITPLSVNDISSKYNVDIERVYAVGYSNGGMMAYGLANYKSDLIAAVGSVSGAS